MSFLPAVTYEQFCLALGALFLLDWLFFLPLFRVGFSRHEDTNFSVDDRGFRVALAALWLAGVAGLVSRAAGGRLVGSLLLTLIFRHYFIARRWSSVRRGFGAPGFMAHWAARVIFLVELVRHLDGEGASLRLLVAAIRWDFGWIMVCAGSYKLLVGYLHNNGMEFGRVNPIWGYHWRFFSKVSPNGWYPTLLNYLACLVEVVSGTLMLVPHPVPQRLGAIAITLSFAYVALFIRLGRLAVLMSVLPFLFWPSVAASIASEPTLPGAPWAGAGALLALRAALWAFIVLLPVVKAMQYLNLFLDRTLPRPLQQWLTAYANRVPIIIWRVFTADVTDFYVRVWGGDAAGRRVEPIVTEESYGLAGWGRPRFKLRLLHVTESIALVSVFTTLKYFPSNRALFEDKLRRYAASLLLDWGRNYEALRFEYVRVEKLATCFAYAHKGDFVLDLASGAVREENVAPGFSFSDTAKQSPVRESVGPGSWAPRSAGET
jgi:hypothetical protein